MSTKLNSCKAIAGWHWFYAGLKVFIKRPGEAFLVGNTYIFLLLVLGGLLSLPGMVVLMLFYPCLGFGLMVASRTLHTPVHLGPKASPAQLFSGLHTAHRQHFKPLLKLGGVYALIMLLASLLGLLVLGRPPEIALDKLTELPKSELLVLVHYLRNLMLWMGIVHVISMMIFWYAPVLMVWHNMGVAQALFSSVLATWRNFWPFMVYGVCSFVGLMLFVMGGMTLALLIGLPGPLLGALYVLLLAMGFGVFVATLYPTYHDVFFRGV